MTADALFGPIPPAFRRLAIALVALTLALEGFAYFGYGGFARTIAAKTAALSTAIQQDGEPLRKRLADLKARQPNNNDPRARLRDFLKDVDAAAARQRVHVIKLVPRLKDETTLDVELESDLAAFLRFATDIEGLDATIRELKVKTAPDTPSGARLQMMTFSVAVPRGTPLAGKHIERLRERAADRSLRNAFAPVSEDGGSGNEMPLPGSHKLTGITRLKDAYMATIDGLDYEVGSSFEQKSITAIRDDRVLLSDGTNRYVLRLPRRKE